MGSRSPFRRAIGAVAATVVIGAAAAGAVFQSQAPSTGPPPPPPGTANVWMSTSGLDSVAAGCIWHSSPVLWSANGGAGCATLDAEMQLAVAAGGTAGVEAGTYTPDFVIGSNSVLTNYVSFVPDGGTVTFQGQICLGSTGSQCVMAKSSPSWVKFDALANTGSTFVYQTSISVGFRSVQSQHIVFNGGHTAATGFSSVNDLTISNMEIGPNCCSSDGIHSSYGASTPQISNVTLTGNYIHGISHLCSNYPGQSSDGVGPATCPGDTTIHVDGIQLDTANNLTITRNRITGNAEQGIFLGGVANAPGVSVFPSGTSCPTPAADSFGATVFGCYEGTIRIDGNAVGDSVEVGNNPFILGRGSPTTPGDCSAAGNSTNPEFGTTSSMLVGYNSTTGNLSQIRSCSLPASIVFTGNAAGWSSITACNAAVKTGGTETFSHNFFVGKVCGATDTLLTDFTTSFANITATNADFHLIAFAPELLGGDTANCPSTDIDGASRAPSVCDAGADQVSVPAGGSGGSGLAAGLSAKTSVTSGGQTRKYRVYVPASCAVSGCPLVVFLNGSISATCTAKTSFDLMMDCDLGTNTTSTTAQMGQSTWATEADTVGAVVLFLEGAPNTCFSSGVCTGWNGLTSDDGLFIKDAITQVETSGTVGANIDTTQVYLTGFSGGGSATSWVSCGSMQGANRNTNSNYKTPQPLFAGFGMWAAGQLGTANTEAVSPACSWPTTPIPTIFVTSKGDATATYEPAPSRQTFACSTQPLNAQCFVRTTTTAAAYLAQWGCTAATLVTTSSGATQRDKRSYDPCSSTGAAFEWDSFGASQTVGPAHGMTNYNAVTNVPAMMWAFWSAH